MFEDRERCERAVASRDARFDGWFVTAVLTTGIYCRPSCPARTPRPENMRFYPTAAAAHAAGFRACKRCRPDASPGSPEWDQRADVVARAMRLVIDGTVDREGVAGVARRVGYSVRHLERVMRAELGAGPLALARAQRAQTARLLVETTDMPFSDLAFAAGFASIRQFNETVREVYALTPTELRARARRARHASPGLQGSLGLRLPLRLPFAPDGTFGHLAATAVPGCEEVRAGAYRRSLRLPHGSAIVDLTPHSDHVGCTLTLEDLRDLPAAIARTRRLLDLDADPVAVAGVLGADPALAPLVASAPGRRVPRTVDGCELAVRAVLGQQVSTEAARTVTARLVATHGDALVDPSGGLRAVFPSAKALAALDPAALRLPAARQATFATLVDALAREHIRLDPGADWSETRARLAELPGVGPWTIETIAMRALGDPDAFPASDLGLVRAAKALGIATSATTLRRYAERWRPWRSYAAQYLWATLPHRINDWPSPKEAA